MSAVLVTGGAGFVGSHLCKKLLEMGETVICLDNFVTGRIENLSDLKLSERFEFIEHDIENPIDLDVSKIYNLACPASPIQYQKDPLRTTRTSVLGAINVLNLAREKGAKVIQASTSEVYGDPHITPQTEDYWGNVNPIGPRACYDEGKRCAETLFFDYQRMFDVEIRVARIFNTYGPKMCIDDGRVVSNFIIQALRGNDLTVYGDGMQTRSLCYVSDTVRGLIMLMETKADIRGPVNLGSEFELTVKRIAETICGLTNSNSSIIYQELPTDDPKQRRPDISYARESIGWTPDVLVEVGLRKTIEYFEDILQHKGG